MKQLLRRLLLEDSGQDVIEYALLSASVAIMGIAVWQNIGDTLGQKYDAWDGGVAELWDPAPPISGGS
jgi:Flp pilus assembly pilin Flp